MERCLVAPSTADGMQRIERAVTTDGKERSGQRCLGWRERQVVTGDTDTREERRRRKEEEEKRGDGGSTLAGEGAGERASRKASGRSGRAWGEEGGGGEGRSRVVSRKPERARVGRGGGRKREQGVGRIN